MKLTKSIKIKIGKLSNIKRDILNTLLKKNIEAINFCLQKEKEGNKITHQLVYRDLRKLDLPATIIHGCRTKSVEIIKSYRKIKKKNKNANFPELKNSRVRYDNVNVKLRKTDNKLYRYFISLLYKVGIQGKSDNRIELPLIINSIYQQEIIQQMGDTYKLGASELVRKNDDYFIHISYSKDVNIPIPNNSFSPIGVDIGQNNWAVSVAPSSVGFYNGKRMNWKSDFFRQQRRKLQENLALQELKRLRNKQTRYNNHYINEISKNIIEHAKKEVKPVIVMEDLTHIRETSKVRKKQNYRQHSWIFKRLQKSIEYKALWEEMPVIYVDPYHSSQICSKCGELNKRNKHTYKCKECCFECNADYNAGRNLQHFFLAKCQEEQASINNAFSPNKSEPEALKNIGVENLQKNNGGEFYGIL